MSPKEFAERMHFTVTPEHDFWVQGRDAVLLMCTLLEELGYEEGVDIFRDACRWIA